MLRDQILLFFSLKKWRDLDFFEQKLQRDREISYKKSEMSCENHWEENVSLADGNKWRREQIVPCNITFKEQLSNEAKVIFISNTCKYISLYHCSKIPEKLSFGL